MTIYEQTKESATLGYTDDQAKLRLHAVNGPVEHKKAFGRVAISCPRDQARISRVMLRDSFLLLYCFTLFSRRVRMHDALGHSLIFPCPAVLFSRCLFSSFALFRGEHLKVARLQLKTAFKRFPVSSFENFLFILNRCLSFSIAFASMPLLPYEVHMLSFDVSCPHSLVVDSFFSKSLNN